MPNPFRKSTDIDNPYATYTNPQGWEWRILKTYKQPSSELKDPYARWFVAARSPMSDNRWEMGDTYKTEVLRYGRLQSATQEWKDTYA